MPALVYKFGAWHGLVSLRKRRVLWHTWGEDPRVSTESAAVEVELHEFLNDYYSGRAVEPACWPVDLEGLGPFDQAVYKVVRGIPKGKTATYGDIATWAGSPGGARAVGNALARNPIPLFIPCHRVCGADGLGGWSGPPGWKERLLVLEGAGVTMRA